MAKRLAFNVLRVGISLGLILFLFWMMRGSYEDVVSAIKKANLAFLFLSVLFVILGMLLLSARLRSIMTAQHLRLTLKEAVSLTFIGHFFNNFLPTSIGGDLMKAYYVSRRTGKKLSSATCVIFDRLLGTFTLVLMVFVSYLFVKEASRNRSITTFLIIAAAVFAAAGTILFSRKVVRRIPFLNWTLRKLDVEKRMKTVYEIIYNYKRHTRLILNALFLSFALQISAFYAVYLLTRGLGFSVPLRIVFLFMPIISTVSMAPSINGLGVREGSFVLLFGPIIGKEAAFTVSILYLGLNFCVSLIGGLFYLSGKQYHIKEGVRLT